MSRRMAPYRWNNNRNDRRENHGSQHQQQQNNTQALAEQQDNINNDEQSRDDQDTLEYTVKILLTNQTAWSISSRNEAKVSWMLEKFSSDVRLSRNDDFYPNTSDRICMIIGKKKAIKETLEWILNINNTNDEDNYRNLIMLVPKTSLGGLLNRGYGIQALRERGNVEIHVPEQKPDCVLREVCTSIAGKKNNIIDTIIAIAKIILSDPFSAVCKNISYEEFNMYLKRKEYINAIPNYASMPRTGMQQISASPMMNTSWLYQQQQQQQPSSMQNYQNQNLHQQHQPQQNQFQQQYQRQNIIEQQQLQEVIEQQQSYQPAVFTNQLTNFYYQHNKSHFHRQQQISFFQKQQQQQQQQPQQQQQDILDQLKTINHEEKSVAEEVTADKSNEAGTGAADNESKTINENETGNPIPSVTSVWRRASSDMWRFGNNRTSSNGQSNVELIPGIN